MKFAALGNQGGFFSGTVLSKIARKIIIFPVFGKYHLKKKKIVQ